MRREAPTHDLRSTSRSQHFLRDPAFVRALVGDMRLPAGALVVEPGPGRGMLTGALLDAGCRVIAVEKDVRLYRALRSRYIGRTNIGCHHGDILEFPLPREPYSVVANVPFAITAAFMRMLLHASTSPVEAHLILQREAAQRFAGTPAETRISLLHKPNFSISIVRAIDAREFAPPPPVECAMLHLQRREHPLLPPRQLAVYRAFVMAAFGPRRQRARDGLRLFFTERQLVRLGRDLGFARDARPSELRFEQWLGLFRFHAAGRLARDPTLRAVRLRSPREHASGHLPVRSNARCSSYGRPRAVLRRSGGTHRALGVGRTSGAEAPPLRLSA